MKLLIQIVMFFLFTSVVLVKCVFAQELCEQIDSALMSNAKAVKYVDLPKDLKIFMKKNECEVTSESVYNYGSAIDLNDDGEVEYAFCCLEAMHGPCYMNIFGKVDGTWRILCDFLSGFDMGGNDPGFIILTDKNEGYHSLCQNDRLIQFKKGKYIIEDESLNE